MNLKICTYQVDAVPNGTLVHNRERQVSNSRIACNLRTAMSQLPLVFLPLDCGASLFKAPPVCLFTRVINDYQNEIKINDNIKCMLQVTSILI